MHALEMTDRTAFRRLTPVTASLLLHVGIVGAIVLGPGWMPVRMPTLIAELVEAEPPPVPKPAVRDRRPVTPPKPIATPRPAETPAPARPEPPAPRPVVPEPAAVTDKPPKPTAPEPPAVATPEPETPRLAASEPVGPPTPPTTAAPPAPANGPSAPIASAPSPGAFAAPPSRSGPPAPEARGPVVAAYPPEGVTQRAIPRGGYQYRPAYPSSARSLGIQGTTLLHVLVSNSGRVAEVVVKQSAGHPDLDKAAADAVRRWRFEPARRGSDPVEMWVQLPFEFRLR